VRVSVRRELPGVVNGEVRRAEVLQLLVRVAAAPATHLVTARIQSTFGNLDRSMAPNGRRFCSVVAILWIGYSYV
jgi:hypothetical protein